MASIAVPAPGVKCVGCDVFLPAKPRYVRQEGASHWAVATAQRLTFVQCPSEAKAVHVPPQCLPFGLLESVVVERTDGAAHTGTRVSLALHRLFGRRESEQRPFGVPIALCGHELNIDDESAHQHVKDVYTLTKHDFRHRMVAACSVMNIAVQFHNGPSPASFTVTLYGVNVLPEALTWTAAAAQMDAKVRVPFVLPPIPPKVRQQGAAAAVASVQDAAAADSAPKNKPGKRNT